MGLPGGPRFRRHVPGLAGRARRQEAGVEDGTENNVTEHRAKTASGIYGTILVTAVIAGVSADPNLDVWRGSVVVLVTALVFWLAHIYANLLALHHVQRRHSSWAQAREGARQEWPLIQAGVLPILILLVLGATGITGRDTAFSVAAWSGVVVLFIWGIVLARREGLGILGTFLSATFSAALGAVVIILKLIVVH